MSLNQRVLQLYEKAIFDFPYKRLRLQDTFSNPSKAR